MRNRRRMLMNQCASGIACCLLFSLFAASSMAKGPSKQKTAKSARAVKKYGIASGADQVLSSVYDPSTNTLRVSGGGGSGTVTSVGLSAPSIFNVTGSPITGSGTLAVSLATENPNTVLAGPSSGGVGSPGFRTLMGADIPAINLGMNGNGGVTGTLGLANGGTGLTSIGSNGQCLASNGSSLVWSACGSGTVTSVGLTLPAGFGSTVSPITTSGTFSISMPSGWGNGSMLVGSGANSVANLPLGTSGQCLTSNGTTVSWGSCGTSGGSATFQVNGANTSSQTAINFQNGGYISVSNPSAGNVQLNFSGTLGIANGGTGLTTAGTSGQCLTSTGSAIAWGSCGTGTGITLQTNGTNNVSQTALNLVAGSGVTLTNTSGGNVTIATSSSGTGLPSSWTVSGSSNSVAAQPVSGQDAPTLVLAPSLQSGGTADIFDVCSQITSGTCSGSKYFGVTWNGNLIFNASNLQLSPPSGSTAPAYFYLNGTNSVNAEPYLEHASSALSAPVLGSLSSGSGSISAGAQYIKITYVNPAGETTASNEQTITLGASSSLIIPNPGLAGNAFGYQIYQSTATGTEQLIVPTSSNCTLAAQTFEGRALCAANSTATFTSLPTQQSATPPLNNTTGGAYHDYLASSVEGNALFLSSGAPSLDAAAGAGVVLPGGTGISFTAGSNTTANTLACLSGSNTASQCGANATGAIGVFISGVQNTLVQTTGVATINLASSATTTYNDFACTNATAGTIVDNGATDCGAQRVGFIAQTNGTAVSSVPVFLRPGSAGTSTPSAGFFNTGIPYGAGSLSPSTAHLVMSPIYILTQISVSHIDFNVTAADASGSYDVCIYNNAGGFGGTANLVADLGTGGTGIHLGTTGINDDAFTQGSVTLQPGWYNVAYAGNALVATIRDDSGSNIALPYASGTNSTTAPTANGACPSSAAIPAQSYAGSGYYMISLHN